MTRLVLPGSSAPLVLGEPTQLDTRSTPPTSRAVYAAAHVVADPLVACAANPGPDQIDWDATLRLRHDLWALGLGIAESMDTAQRGMGLDWAGARELAQRTLAEARSVGGKVVVGIGTDQLAAGPATVEQIRDAYLEQVAAIEAAGGEVVMMASRHLAEAAQGPDDYLAVYDAVLSAATKPVVLHWLGSVFDPALAGYWGFDEPKDAMDTVVAIMTAHRDTVRGIKVSLLDPALEIALRQRIPDRVRVFTGDDYNYVDMIAGDGSHTSDALLGAFAAIGPFASAAFARLDAGDETGFRGDPLADRAAEPADLRRPDAVLQGRGGVAGVPERPPGPLPDARRLRNRPQPHPPRRPGPGRRRDRPVHRPGVHRRTRRRVLRGTRDRLNPWNSRGAA